MTWEECEDQLTWVRIEALYMGWRKSPPVHESLAAFLGIDSAQEEKHGDVTELLSLFPEGKITTGPGGLRL